MRYTLKSIPPILVSLMAFLWSLRICKIYNILLGIILMVIYLFMVFFTNMLIPLILKRIKAIPSINKVSIYFLIMSIVVLIIGVVLRFTLASSFSYVGIRNLDVALMLFFALSCGHYSVFLALNTPSRREDIQKENK